MYKLLSQKIWSEEILWHFEFRNPQVPYPLHLHNFHEIVVVYSGKGTHITHEGSSSVQTGDVFSVKPGQVHGYKKLDRLVLMNILIKPVFFEDDMLGLENLQGYADLFRAIRSSDAEKTPITSFSLNHLQLFEVRALIESMQNEISDMHLGWEAASTSFLNHLLILLLRIYNDPSYPDTNAKNNGAALVKYMEKSFAKKLTMKDLTEHFNMSESTILRTFKRMTGYAPFEYQMRERMHAATNELLSTDKDITRIAYDIGFSDSNYFSRCFKKFINMTPREYRVQFKQ